MQSSLIRFIQHRAMKGLSGRASGGALSLETLEDMLRKSPDAGISQHGGPFPPGGTSYVGGLVHREL